MTLGVLALTYIPGDWGTLLLTMLTKLYKR